QWIAHFVNEPTVSGTVVNTQVPGHIVTYNGQYYTATNGNGSVALRTLLPTQSTARKVGGPGYEYYVNGVNYPTAYQPDLNFYTPGSWRIEVRPATLPPDGKVVYMHTIKTGTDVQPAQPGGLALQSPHTLGADWENTLYFLAADGGINKDYHILNGIQGNRSVHLLAVDLQPGTYHIRLNNNVVATVPTDTNGVLRHTLNLPAGSHTIEILKAVQSTDPATLPLAEVSVYPNPAQDYLVIRGNFPDLLRVDVLTTDGRLVASYQNRLHLDVSPLPAGVYVLRIVSESEFIMRKFVKN
ncbi:MAG: T9SS type A sorting domain-containing protein, partial [Flavobacteriales bacterium]|nr:T9SS type A sorting domain-containing protein [Flavobacteriales bacterium]MDW8410963.1 T9SS type A sorting domain-containing protein [Flavobacteriales bacterium]